MSKILSRSKYIVWVLCIVVLGGVLSATYFVMHKSSSGNLSSSQASNRDEFNFKLNFSTFGKEQIDTYKGTYTKDLVLNGTKTINFKLPDNVKNEIYKLMMDINIMSFPDTLKADGMAVTPSCDYKLTVTIKGKTKSIEWKEGFYTFMTENLPKENVNFLKLVKYIGDYIHSTEEYKNMPEANGGYD
jgi:hypothetical protein